MAYQSEYDRPVWHQIARALLICVIVLALLVLIAAMAQSAR